MSPESKNEYLGNYNRQRDLGLWGISIFRNTAMKSTSIFFALVLAALSLAQDTNLAEVKRAFDAALVSRFITIITNIERLD